MAIAVFVETGAVKSGTFSSEKAGVEEALSRLDRDSDPARHWHEEELGVGDADPDERWMLWPDE